MTTTQTTTRRARKTPLKTARTVARKKAVTRGKKTPLRTAKGAAVKARAVKARKARAI